MKKLIYVSLFLFAFSTFAFAQKEQVVKFPGGKTSVTFSGVTRRNNEIIYVLKGLKPGQTFTISVAPKNLVIGLLVDYVEAEAEKGKLVYKVFKGQEGIGFQFTIGNGYKGIKYKATVTVK